MSSVHWDIDVLVSHVFSIWFTAGSDKANLGLEFFTICQCDLHAVGCFFNLFKEHTQIGLDASATEMARQLFDNGRVLVWNKWIQTLNDGHLDAVGIPRRSEFGANDPIA